MEPTRVTLRPARPGLKVPDPDRGGLALPPEGREVAMSSHWHRRLEDGDVVVVEAHPTPSPRARGGEPKSS